MEDYGAGSSDGETNGDIYQDMRDFDKRLGGAGGKKDDPFFNQGGDSSDEDGVGGPT